MNKRVGLRSWSVWALMALVVAIGITFIVPPSQAQTGKVKFDHDTTGFQLIGAHAKEQCDSCHKQGIFKGTPKNCVSCHIKGSQTATTFKHTKHIPTRDACSLCHNNASWTPARMSHNLVTSGGCVTCHNGAFTAEGVTGAQGRPSNHNTLAGLPNSQTDKCDTCHRSTSSWVASVHQHGAGDQGRCSTCHNGKRAIGAPSGHIPTTLTPGNCDNCHTSFVAFAPARMNHTGTATKCESCHTASGQYRAYGAEGKPATHSALFTGGKTCDGAGCHAGTTNWIVSWTHSAQAIGDHSCVNCHGASATSPGLKMNAAKHIPNGAAYCDDCHNNFTSFSPALMSHPAVSATSCTSCHNGTFASQGAQGKSAKHIPILPASKACSACHTNFAAFQPAQMDHSGTTGLCSNCHNGSFVAANAQTKPATHVKTAAQCDSCHKSTTSWATAVFDHASANPAVVMGDHTCETCHKAGGTGLSKPAGHIPSTAACDTCHKNFVSFSPAQMNHAGVGTCSTCHNGSYLFANAQAKSSNHIPTTRGCDFCHTNFTAFQPAQMNHTLDTAGQCATCHMGNFLSANAQTKSANHVATTQQCDTCHKSTVTWATVTYSHATTDTVCDTCHKAGGPGLPKPVTHIPTTAQCSSCHANYISFAPAQMNHTGTGVGAGVGSHTCATCHSGSYVAVNALAKPATHILTTAQCDTCHASTTTWLGATFDHAGNTPPVVIGAGACGNCHDGRQAKGKPVIGHIPTTRACDNCHTNFTTFKPATMDHGGTAGTCSTCHGGQFTAVNAQAKQSGHVATTAQCDTCHSSFTNWASAVTYVHPASATGTCATCHTTGGAGLPKNATHIPTTAQCDTCHKNYVAFAPAAMSHTGLTTCSSCHAGQSFGFKVAVAESKSVNHITVPAGKECSACHKNFVSFTPATMDHSGTANICTTCHNGNANTLAVNAQYKTASHTPTTAQCDTCHKSTITWATISFVHAAGDTACDTCHAPGASGLPKPTGTHIPTSSQCTVCHTNPIGKAAGSYSFVYTGTSLMNHTGMAGPAASNNCATCHNGSYLTQGVLGAYQKPGNHITTAAQCDTCHTPSTTASYTKWTGVTYTHTTTDTLCSNCHNGTQAMGKNATHVPTSSQCSTCHKNFVAFKPAIMDHALSAGPAAAVGAHNCSTCHNGSYLAVNALAKHAAHVTTAAECDTCHSSTTAWAAGVRYTHAVGDTVCDTCHKTGGSGLPKQAGHVPTMAQCSVCHGSQVSFRTSVNMDHAGTTGPVAVGNCATCHNGSYTSQMGATPGLGALAKNTGHVPVTGQCDACHGSSNFTTFVNAAAGNHANFAGPVAAGNCATCHTGTYSTTTWGAVLGKPAGLAHIPTTKQCDTCHTSTSLTSGFATWTMNHTGTSGQCSTCHTGTYPNGLGKNVGHVVTAAQCDTCHSGFSTWKGAATHTGTYMTQCGVSCHNGGVTPGTAKPATGHIPTTALCGTCHNTTTFKPATMNHAGTTGPLAVSNCSTCHNGSYLTANAQSKPATHVTTSAQCDTCHTPVNHRNYTTWVTTTYNHATTDTACDSCHKAGGSGLSKPSTHIPTALQCSTCHTNPIGKAAGSYVFAYTSTSLMNHTGATACSSCHNGSYTNQGVSGAYWVGGFGALIQSLHTNFGALQCSQCHKSFTTWAKPSGMTMDHTGLTNCNLCHGVSTWTSLNVQIKPATTHIPTTAQCSVCHKNFTAFTSPVMSHTGTTGPTAAVGGNTCNQCHNGSYTTQGTVGAKGMPSNHSVISTAMLNGSTMISGSAAKCDACHSSTTAWTTINMRNATGHNNSMGNGSGWCYMCHNTTGTSFPGPLTKFNLNHRGGTQTDCSKSGCHRPGGTAGTSYSKWN